jgi:hypothetical protein
VAASAAEGLRAAIATVAAGDYVTHDEVRRRIAAKLKS